MSILAYVGLPGSGKSYDVVANQVLPALRQGRTVVTNIPLNVDRIRELVQSGEIVEFPTERIQANAEEIFEYAQPGVVLILDEVWRLFPAGQTAKQVPEPFKKLLAEHRHMVNVQGDSMQIVLVTQDLAQIGAFARQLVEQTVCHTKLSSIGASKSYRIDIYAGPVTGQKPPQGKRIREIFGRYDKKITDLYKSHTMSQSAEGGANEAAADSRGNVFKRPMIWVSLVAIIIAFAWGIPAAVHSIRGDDRVAKEKALHPSSSQTAVQSTGVLQQAEAEYALSCMSMAYSTGDVNCECRGAGGGVVHKGYACVKYMKDHVGNYGGLNARSDNIGYLNARDAQSQKASPAS